MLVFDTFFDEASLRFVVQSSEFPEVHAYGVLLWAQARGLDDYVQAFAVPGTGVFVLRSRRRFATREAAERALARLSRVVDPPWGSLPDDD